MEEGKARLLIVDDEESMRNILLRTLEEEGYSCTVVADGKEALWTSFMVDFDLVLLDIKMPGMSGMEVLSRLASNHPDVKVIMVTSLADPRTADEAIRAGACEFVPKPLDLNDLVGRIDMVLEKKAHEHGRRTEQGADDQWRTFGLTPDEFSMQAHHWYEMWAAANPLYADVEKHIMQTASTIGHLTVEDLATVAWAFGDDRMSILMQLCRHNTDCDIRQATSHSIVSLDDPSAALASLLTIGRWGLAYSSRTLQCIRPSEYAALDHTLRKHINRDHFPSSTTHILYSQFLGFAREIASKAPRPGPRNGEWFLADIGAALWQFSWYGGRLL